MRVLFHSINVEKTMSIIGQTSRLNRTKRSDWRSSEASTQVYFMRKDLRHRKISVGTLLIIHLDSAGLYIFDFLTQKLFGRPSHKIITTVLNNSRHLSNFKSNAEKWQFLQIFQIQTSKQTPLWPKKQPF